jgi:hypothetical protein
LAYDALRAREAGMTDDEFIVKMRAELMLDLLNPDYPIIKTTEESDALHDDFMIRLLKFVFDTPRESGD